MTSEFIMLPSPFRLKSLNTASSLRATISRAKASKPLRFGRQASSPPPSRCTVKSGTVELSSASGPPPSSCDTSCPGVVPQTSSIQPATSEVGGGSDPTGDASPTRLFPISRDYDAWRHTRAAATRSAGFSLLGLSLAILAIYSVMNALTKGYFRARLVFQGLPKGPLTVAIKGVTTRGRTVRSTRTYNLCTKRR